MKWSACAWWWFSSFLLWALVNRVNRGMLIRIVGLLQTLPRAMFGDTGAPETEWTTQARAKWLQTAANIFDLIYKGDGGIKIEAAMAQRSPRPGDQLA
jgi:hypothetical protein